MIEKLIVNLKLNKEARAELDSILELPEVDAILGRREEKIIAHRVELANRLASVDPRHKKLIASADQLAAEASHRFYKAEAELRIARDARMVALMQAQGVSGAREKERNDILEELEQGCDRRIGDLHVELCRADDQARVLLTIWPIVTSRTFGGNEKTYADNSIDIIAARTALQTGKLTLAKMAISALTRKEITKTLVNICNGIALPLFALELDAPSIDEHGEVKPVHRFTGEFSKRLEAIASLSV